MTTYNERKPGRTAPGHTAPGHTALSHTEPSRPAHNYTEPNHTDSSHTDSSHTDSSHTDSSHTDSSPTDSNHTDSSHTDSNHTERTSAEADALVEFRWLSAGYCKHPERLTLRGGTLRPVAFPAGFGLIRHPRHGLVLFDTGYSGRFFAETNRFPARLYRMTTPVVFEERDGAVRQLERMGIAAEEIRNVVLSHFHADHTAGLRDFPHATILYKREAYAAVRRLGRFASVRAGYLPGLLPDDLESRSAYIEDAPRRPLPERFPFRTGYDLFGDGSLVAVDVPGHAAGQIGLFLATADAAYFLCADAVWSSRAYRERRLPHAAARLVMDDYGRYADSFERLCRLHREYPHIRIVPSHCVEALRELKEEGEALWQSESAD